MVDFTQENPGNPRDFLCVKTRAFGALIDLTPHLTNHEAIFFSLFGMFTTFIGMKNCVLIAFAQSPASFLGSLPPESNPAKPNKAILKSVFICSGGAFRESLSASISRIPPRLFLILIRV